MILIFAIKTSVIQQVTTVAGTAMSHINFIASLSFWMFIAKLPIPRGIYNPTNWGIFTFRSWRVALYLPEIWKQEK